MVFEKGLLLLWWLTMSPFLRKGAALNVWAFPLNLNKTAHYM